MTKSKHNNDKKCQYCGTLFSEHPKCIICQILLHPKDKKYECKRCRKQHTKISTRKQNCCEDCYKLKRQ